MGCAVKSGIRSENRRVTIRDFAGNAYMIMYAAAYQDTGISNSGKEAPLTGIPARYERERGLCVPGTFSLDENCK